MFDILLILLTAILTGIVSYFVTQRQVASQQEFWYQQQRMLSADKHHEIKLQYLDRAERELTEHSRIAFIWFFADINTAEGFDPGDYDNKHNAYHRSEASINALLQLLPFFFSEPVQRASDDLGEYLGRTQWETTIQAPVFIKRAKTLDSKQREESNITQLVSKEIHIDEYNSLVTRLTSAMADEIAHDFDSQ